MAKPQFLRSACLVSIILAGCQAPYQVHDPDYPDVAQSRCESMHGHDIVQVAFDPQRNDLIGPQPVEYYIGVALRQNADIQAARKQIEADAFQVPVAGSLQDPTLGITALPEPIQTAAGEQQVSISASQKIPWLGKLSRRASVAEAQTNVARAEFAAVELRVIEKVKRLYYELYFLQKTIEVTKADQKLLGDIRKVAETRYKAGRTSQQDVLRADLEVSNVESELIRLKQRLESAQARLAKELHVSPQTKLAAINELPTESIPSDLTSLQEQAVMARPELHAQLASLEKDEQKLALARLDYYPDFTVGATWIAVDNGGVSPVANGRDSFLIGTAINLPVYRRRLNSAVRSAEAQVVASARRYDSLRDATLEEVTDLFARAQSEKDLLTLFREDILPRARQTLEVSSQAYNVGEVDFLQLVDNWRQLLRYQVTFHRLEASLRQSMAELERIVGGYANSELQKSVEPVHSNG